MKNKALSLSALVLTTGLTLAACSSDDADTDATATTTESSASESMTESKESSAAEVTLEDGVVKAKAAGEPMTAIFGELTNTSDKDIVIESFTTSLGEARYEIHEVVNGSMREREEELRIPAGKSHELKPGDDHLMIMDYDGEIAAGDEITITLKLADGGEVELAPVPVRTIGAGDEEYGDLEGHGGHEGHDHEGHDHSEHDGHDHGEHN
ncbi:copper chaperone PCu(A)C [Corynebacterium sp. MSK297]|uniref:copper chaperone PCu(A)C n=1 Tax=Corynebacterium sp. MSK297 TaxID=3050221 RepID=UPI00254FF206|nr:copper chaperone PCu(A)C [Corynebacterium sp. MSK297]MDK8845010.1 copper chaperone PCu(A)C [Corynebacterium sp. MSK297]